MNWNERSRVAGRTRPRWLATAVVTAGLLVAGGGMAAADATPVPTSTTPSPEQLARLCQERIPAILGRIDRLDARIGGDAATPGSTAWMQARIDRARDQGRDALADWLADRRENRVAADERLAAARDRVETYRDERCG